MGEQDEFPCEGCLTYPVCVGRYRNWKEIMIKKGYEGVNSEKYVNSLCNKCRLIDQYLFEEGSYDTERFLLKTKKLMRKFDGLPM